MLYRKPLLPTYQDSLAIYESLNAKNILFVSYYRPSLPPFSNGKKWIDSNSIGEVRHIRWHLSRPTTKQDLSDSYNWRTDAQSATAGCFYNLARHGLDLIVFLLGNIKEVSGTSINQQGMYSAKDAVSASWLHESGITDSGSWNFGPYMREDIVEK